MSTAFIYHLLCPFSAPSLDVVRVEFAEFQESSGELEGELEAQLDQVSNPFPPSFFASSSLPF